MKKGSFDQFAEVADVKRKNPDAKVWVSIGGWDFSNNGYVLPKLAKTVYGCLHHFGFRLIPD